MNNMKRILTLILPVTAVLVLMAPTAVFAQLATPTPKHRAGPPPGVAGPAVVHPMVTHTPPPVVHTTQPIVRATPPPVVHSYTPSPIVHTRTTPPPTAGTTPFYKHKPVTNPNVATGQPTPTQGSGKPVVHQTTFTKSGNPGGGPPIVNNKVFVHTTPAIVKNTSWAGPKRGGGGVGSGGQVYNRSNNYGGNWVAANTYPTWNRTQVNFYNGHHYRWFNGGWLIVDNGFWPAGYYQIQPGGSKMWNTQAELANMGYYNGTVDGIPGPETRQAIADYQADNGLPIDGHLNPPTQVALGLEPPDYAAGYNQ